MMWDVYSCESDQVRTHSEQTAPVTKPVTETRCSRPSTSGGIDRADGVLQTD